MVSLCKTLYCQHEQPFLREGLLFVENRERSFRFPNKKEQFRKKRFMMQARFLFLCARLFIITKNERKNGTFIKNGKNVQNRWKIYRKRQTK